ncbi:MAG: PLDc N-terminal domain-containing protein [Candidatus Zixiibacteriota bacterium]
MNDVAFIFGSLPIILISILYCIFGIVTLVDAVRRKYEQPNDKIMWVALMLCTGFIGSIIYYFEILRKEKSCSWFWIPIMLLLSILAIAVISSIIIGTSTSQ